MDTVLSPSVICKDVVETSARDNNMGGRRVGFAVMGQCSQEAWHGTGLLKALPRADGPQPDRSRGFKAFRGGSWWLDGVPATCQCAHDVDVVLSSERRLLAFRAMKDSGSVRSRRQLGLSGVEG